MRVREFLRRYVACYGGLDEYPWCERCPFLDLCWEEACRRMQIEINQVLDETGRTKIGESSNRFASSK